MHNDSKTWSRQGWESPWYQSRRLPHAITWKYKILFPFIVTLHYTIRKYMPCPEEGQCILFSVVFTSTSPTAPQQCLGPTCHLSTLNYNTVSPVRACLSIWKERFHGTQKEDDRGPQSIQSSVPCPYSFHASYMYVKRKINEILRYKGNCF